jgi:hypothetical protein
MQHIGVLFVCAFDNNNNNNKKYSEYLRIWNKPQIEI